MPDQRPARPRHASASAPLSRRARRIDQRSIARHGRLKRRSPLTTLFGGLGFVLAVLLVSGLALGGLIYADLMNRARIVDISQPGEAEAPSDINSIEGGLNVLLVGSDTREGQGAEYGEGEEDAAGVLNDVNILFHLSKDHSRALAVSLPRDTMITTTACKDANGSTKVGGGEFRQINSLLGEGGLPCVVQNVEHLSGLDVQYAAMVTFKGVIEMSNAIGGVPVCVAQNIEDEYTGLNLTAGEHTLKGADALAFLRTRHGVGDGSDLSRIANQQQFMSSLMRQVKSSNTLGDPGKVYGLANAAISNMTLSKGLNDPQTIASMMVALRDVDLSQVQFIRLPTSYAPAGSGYAGRVFIDEQNADELFRLVKADQPFTLGAGSTDNEGVVPTGAPGTTSPTSAGTGGAATSTPGAGSGAGSGSAPAQSAAPGAATAPAPGDLTATPTITPTPTGPVVLDDSVKGQTAEQQTCAVANNG